MVTEVNIYAQTMAHLHGGATKWIKACTTPLEKLLDMQTSPISIIENRK